MSGQFENISLHNHPQQIAHVTCKVCLAASITLVLHSRLLSTGVDAEVSSLYRSRENKSG